MSFFKGRGAQPRLSNGIISEADLRPFEETDPHALAGSQHGDARFGWLQHLWRADMFQENESYLAQPSGYPIAALFFAGGNARVEGYAVWPHEGHRIIVGPARSGTFAAALAPLLLEDDGANVFVIDAVGGDTAAWTMMYRNTLGVVELTDPLGVFAGETSSPANPLEALEAADGNFVGQVEKLAEALAPDAKDKEPSVMQAGRTVLRALIAHVATGSGFEKRSLREVRGALQNLDLPMLDEIARNGAGGGVLAEDAAVIAAWRSDAAAWQRIVAELCDTMRFLDLPAAGDAFAWSAFDVGELRTARQSLYVVVPPAMSAVMGPWLRFLYAGVMNQIGVMAGRPVHVVINGLAALGSARTLLADMVASGHAGIRYHIVVEDLSQLSRDYGHDWQVVLDHCSVLQYLGGSDPFTAEYISKALGATTVQDGYEGLIQKTPRWAPRPLRTPAELLALSPEEMIILTDRAPPFLLPKCPYNETQPWMDRAMDVRERSHGG
jgi:type IV secretory pathway TraG/TraD family ATPase VirD4